MTMKRQIKALLQTMLSRATGHHAVLLRPEASGKPLPLRLRAPYRVDGSVLEIELLEPAGGTLSVTLLGYDGHFPTRPLWHSQPLPYFGPCTLSLDLEGGALRLAEQPAGELGHGFAERRFCLDLRLESAAGNRWRRVGHYRARHTADVGASYFQGDNYVDHAAESAGVHRQATELLRRFDARGPVLEAGCATGGLLAALAAAGLPGVGFDISDWAISQASKTLGPDKAFVYDPDTGPVPPEIAERGPYPTLVLWAVFEHFRDPFGVLAKLGELVPAGGLLVIDTTNADSLTRFLFREQWEGYFDWTHRGIDAVGVRSLAARLPELGWRIDELTTRAIWSSNADPGHATLREWYDADSRFRQLLAETATGDLIQLVARKL